MTRSAQEVQEWLMERVGKLASAPPEQIDPQQPLARYGLDSVAIIQLATELEEWLGFQFRENPIDQHPTIEALAEYAAERAAEDAN